MTAFPTTAAWNLRGRNAPRNWLTALARRSSPEPALRVVHQGETELLRGRDPGTWHAFFQREMPAIYRYVSSRLGASAEAEDATSQVFEEAWEHAASLKDQGLPARAWLFGIARNVVNTHRRSWLRRAPALSLEAFDGFQLDPGLDADRLDLGRAIASLDPSYADVISLRFIHGLSLQEAAAALGTTVDGVKGRQARGLAELRKKLSHAV